MAIVNTQNSPIFQSGYTYLGAAGSSGADKTIAGCHLRWDLLGTLGDNHLPKGSYAQNAPYQTSSGFNKPNDVVNIYKLPFFGRHFIEWNTSVKPDSLGTTADGVPYWSIVLPVDSSNTNRETEMQIFFTDVALYNALATTYSFSTQWGKILDAYTGIIEVSCADKLSFYWQIISSAADPGVDSGNYSMRVEAVSLPNSLEPNEKQLNYRQTHNNYSSFDFFSENTERIRFDKTNNKIERIRVNTYEDFIYESNAGNGAWEQVGSFALTLDNTAMDNRLRPSDIHGSWPKFSITPTPGEFAVNAQNYIDRWQGPDYTFDSLDESDNDPEGLQTFIHTYLKKSTTDQKAVISFPSNDPDDDTFQTVSCLDMIRLMSLDFHVARILGLGHIDTTFDQRYYQSYYIYCMQYLTKTGLEAPYNGTVDHSHIYMTLPIVSKDDSRLPAAPVLKDVTFGANIDNATGQPAVITDADGYTPQENLRFINLNRAPHAYEKPFGNFFYESTPVNLSRQTQAIGYGLKYKEVNESGYRKPDLNHDTAFLDRSGTIAETTIILENGGPRLFTHMEEEEGTHAYGAFAINWFSRVSPLSNIKNVATLFPKITRLLPPFNYATHLIQDEDPAEAVIAEKALLFTTIAEQEQLALLSAEPDQTLVRTSFDWNHIQNNAHPTVNYAEFFFRENDPLVVKGKITDVIQIDTETVLVKTGSYLMTSSFPAQTVVPSVLAGQVSKLVGSLFSSGDQGYFIEQVQNPGNTPWFKVKALKQNQAVAPDPSNQNQFLTQETYTVPQVGDLFFAIENLSEAANWDLKHTQRAYIERHYTNASIGLRTSSSNVVKYGIKSIHQTTGDTIVELHEKLKVFDAYGISAEYMTRAGFTAQSATQLKITGDWSLQLTNGNAIYLFGNTANDDVYTVSGAVSYNSGLNVSTVNLLEALPAPATTGGFVSFKVLRELDDLDIVDNTVTIPGLYTNEIDAAYVEYRPESDGSETRFVVGGITAPVTFEPLLAENGSGTGYIQVFMNHNLAAHPDPRISWYKGTIRLKTVAGDTQSYPVSYIGNLTSTSTTALALVVQDPGFTVEDPASPGSGDLYTIDLDATSEKGNYHPSYKLYLPYSNGVHPVSGAPVAPSGVHFNEAATLPVLNDPAVSNKKTFMSVRSVDIVENVSSYLAAPSTVLAQKITVPVAPGLPQGPLYATRPDFYAKSTYTFDTQVDTTGGRSPYALVFLKSTNDKLLDVLYKKGTQGLIKQAWSELSPEVELDPQLWQILINGISEPGSPAEFAIYETTAGTFQWPMPDNESFYIPFETNIPISELTDPELFCPFEESKEFSLTSTYPVYGRDTTAAELLKRAVNDCFIPLNEQPPLFMHLKTGRQTSSAPSVIRDTNGLLLDPQTHDIYPMVRKYTQDNLTYVRFTDYTLDGASNCLYFYRAMEMDDKFKFSEAGDALGPVVMVNSFYPERPQIRKVLTRLENPSEEVSAGIVFELNPYAESEIISKLDIYRALDETDALSTRTMTKVKTIEWGDPLVDDFANDAFPLFGENLVYKLVAIREVKDMRDVLGAAEAEVVEIPSHPSDMVKATLIDVINPIAPDLEFVIGGVTDDEYTDVLISWQATCYNGSYSLQKMNDAGNWVEIYHTKQKTGTVSYPPFVAGVPDFVTHTATTLFPRKDEDDQLIYHRFRVQVENSSGLFNLQEKVFILQQLDLVQEDGGNINLEDNSGSLLV